MHPSHYGRMCPIETPEGPNIGLIGYLSSVRPHQPVRLHRDAVPQGRRRRRHRRRSSTSPPTTRTATSSPRPTPRSTTNGRFIDEPRARSACAQSASEVAYVDPHEVDYMDVSPKQIVSVATALIPFLEHDDANRALMGANMQRQAVPVLRPTAPFIGTGVEGRAARDAGDARSSPRTTARSPRSSGDSIIVDYDKAGPHGTYRLSKFRRSNQGTCINQKPLVDMRRQGRRRATCSPTARRRTRASSRSARTSWSRSCRGRATTTRTRSSSPSGSCRDDVLTSIHIEEHEIDARDTKLGAEEITRDIPNLSEDILKDLDERGIIRIGAEVGPGDVLVGKVTPKGETELTPEERLLRAIFGEKAREVRDTSLKVPARRDRQGHRRARVLPRRRRRAAAGREPAGPGLRGPEAQDQRGRQARRPPRQQGRDLEDPPGRGHAPPRRRHAGRHRAQPARCPEPHERRPGARGAPRLRGPPRLGGPAQRARRAESKTRPDHRARGVGHDARSSTAPTGTRRSRPASTARSSTLFETLHPDGADGRAASSARDGKAQLLRRPDRRAVRPARSRSATSTS